MTCLTARAHVNQHLIPGLQMNLAGTLSGEYKLALLEGTKQLFCSAQSFVMFCHE